MIKKFLPFIITLIYALISYYILIPAINIKSPEFIFYVISIIILYSLLNIERSPVRVLNVDLDIGIKIKKHAKILMFIALGILGIYIIISFISLPIFNASKYREQISVIDSNFTNDIQQISFNQVPLVDYASATKLGDRKMGELINLVSQFEVNDLYTQINYNNVPVRVTPLEYASLIKWINNVSKGIPAYVLVDMTTQDVQLVQLEQGMKYSPSELFNRDLNRYLRFKYPTYMFDKALFEIDDNGTPYWVAPRYDNKIMLYGGKDIVGSVLVNAITGETIYYDIKDTPQWIDRVYSSDLIIRQLDNWGKYKLGWFNTIFGQKEMLVTTMGYNYLAINDDVYLYTGVTSVGRDQSNVGFLLVNLRTKDTKFYNISGADEYSAMNSAKGQVQHLNYQPTFPILLNIGNQSTYFISLKDNAGLVKKYAFVNVASYQIVAIGDSVYEAEKEYMRLLVENNKGVKSIESSITGVIYDIRTAVIEGNTNYYIRLQGSDKVFVGSILTNKLFGILNIGDAVSLKYVDSEEQFININEIKTINNML